MPKNIMSFGRQTCCRDTALFSSYALWGLGSQKCIYGHPFRQLELSAKRHFSKSFLKRQIRYLAKKIILLD